MNVSVCRPIPPPSLALRVRVCWRLLHWLLATGVLPVMSAPKVRVFNQPREYFAVRFNPANVPKVDGDLSDWNRVPERYWITKEDMELWKRSHREDDLRVCVGYCAETGRLYFAVVVVDDYLHSERKANEDPYWPYRDDVFEVVVDADRSGGDYVAFRDLTESESRRLRSCPAQNYHVYLVAPSESEHVWLWGDQKWLLDKPYAEWAHRLEGKVGGPAKVALEFSVTPFNYASTAGPELSAIARLVPGRKIGLAWLRLDEDGYDRKGTLKRGDYCIFGRRLELYRNADYCFDVTLEALSLS